MKHKPAVYADTFMGDLANALLLRPPYRRPASLLSPPCASGRHELCNKLAWNAARSDWEYCTCTKCGCDGIGDEAII